jgi:probable HAF family extracellular repeat protein
MARYFRRFALTAALLTALTTAVTAGPAAATPVKVVDLGTLGGAASSAADINQAGVVAGWAETADGQRHAVRWDRRGTVTDLGTAGGREQRGLRGQRERPGRR